MDNPVASGGASADGDARDTRSREQQYFWARYFAVYDTLNQAPPYQHMVARTVAFLQPVSGDRILDAGAGTGNVSLALAVTGTRLVGVDFSAQALERCRAKVPAAEFRFADLTRPLPFDAGSFDKIACCLVLHFLDPDRQAFAVGELFRVLDAGGRLAVTVFAPGLNPLRVYIASLRELARTKGLGPTAVVAVTYLFNTLRVLYYQWRMRRQERTGQYRYFTREGLERVLADAGFVVERIEPSMASQCWTAAAIKPSVARPEASPTRP